MRSGSDAAGESPSDWDVSSSVRDLARAGIDSASDPENESVRGGVGGLRAKSWVETSSAEGDDVGISDFIVMDLGDRGILESREIEMVSWSSCGS